MTPRPETICIATHRHDPDRPRRAADGQLLCAGCIGGLHRHLTDMPGLYEQVVASMPRTRSTGNGRVSGSHEPGLPVNLAAGELRWQIGHDLYYWASEIAVGRGIHLPPSGRVSVVCGWLDRHIPWLAAREEAALFRGVLIELTAMAYRVIDPDRPPLVLGQCVETLDDYLCDGTLRATVLDVDDPRPSRVWCDTCTLELTSEQWHRFGRSYHLRLAAIERERRNAS